MPSKLLDRVSSWQSDVIVILPNCFDSFNVPRYTSEADCQRGEMAGVILMACQGETFCRHNKQGNSLNGAVMGSEKKLIWGVFLLTDLCKNFWKYQGNWQNNKSPE